MIELTTEPGADLLVIDIGATMPVAGFGSSDCRRCPAHLVGLPRDFIPRSRPGRTE